MSSNSDKVDYLTEDSVIPSQKFVVMSILTPSFYKSADGPEQNTTIPEESKGVYGIKVRGSYSTYEEAQKRAKYLQGADSYHNVFIGEVGKWLPFEDSPDKAEDVTYAEDKLNNMMKAYMENQENAKQLYEKRKNDMVMETLMKNKEQKKKNSKRSKASTATLDDKLNDSKVEIDLSELSSFSDANPNPSVTSQGPESSTSASVNASASASASAPSEVVVDKVSQLEQELLKARQQLEEEMAPIRQNFEKVQDIIQAEYGKNKKIE